MRPTHQRAGGEVRARPLRAVVRLRAAPTPLTRPVLCGEDDGEVELVVARPGLGLIGQRRVTDAAIEIIAAGGLRGLTHRTVDAGADLPAGSTSNCFRTRLALPGGVLDRLVELDEGVLERLPADHRLGQWAVQAAADGAIPTTWSPLRRCYRAAETRPARRRLQADVSPEPVTPTAGPVTGTDPLTRTAHADT